MKECQENPTYKKMKSICNRYGYSLENSEYNGITGTHVSVTFFYGMRSDGSKEREAESKLIKVLNKDNVKYDTKYHSVRVFSCPE